jgi:hypothetical protein
VAALYSELHRLNGTDSWPLNFGHFFSVINEIKCSVELAVTAQPPAGTCGDCKSIPRAEPCEQRHEPSVSVKRGEFLD